MNKLLFGLFSLFLLAYSVSAQSKEARKIDEFSFDIDCEESKSKVDLFGTELINNPGSTGYIVFYEGRIYPMPNGNKLPRRNEAKARANEFIKTYVIFRGIGDKVKLIDGGYREKYTIEFWIVPKEAGLPVLAPTVKPENIKFRKGKYHHYIGEGC